MPKVAPLDNMVRQLARDRANMVRQAFADNPSNRYSVMKQMEDDLIGELTPILTKTWKPSMRRGPRGLQDILSSGRFKNQFETMTSAGAFDRMRRGLVSDDYFYGGNISDKRREKYGYLKRPKKAGDDDGVDFYGDYDIEFKPQVRKRMTVTNGDSYNNYNRRNTYMTLGTPIVVDDPETYINWVGAPESFGDEEPATEDLFKQVLNDLKRYHRPTFRDGNENYIEAQYHGPLTVDDIKSIGSSPYVEPWLRKASMKHGIPILDRETGKCIYNCR